MRFIKSMVIIPAAIAAAGIVTGCSYHKTVDETTAAPAPIVETVPAPAPAVVVAPAPVTSSTTTTTTDTSPTVVERQKTTTYIPAPY